VATRTTKAAPKDAPATEPAPIDVPPELEAAGTVAAAATARPLATPPGPGAALTGVTGTGVSDKRIQSLWCHAGARNAYAFVNGVGWKRLVSPSDGGLQSLAALARLARDANARVDYRQEADGAIHELYVW
jgi:hypothetical protein